MKNPLTVHERGIAEEKYHYVVYLYNVEYVLCFEFERVLTCKKRLNPLPSI